MNKTENRHHLIRSLILEKKIHTQSELKKLLEESGCFVTQPTLSRDIKLLNIVKINEEENSYYVINNITPSKLEKRLKFYMEDGLVMLKPVQNQVIMKTLPGLAQSFGVILDGMQIPEIIATVCGDDICLIICDDNEQAVNCFNKLKQFTPPFFFYN